jgi:predicted HTH domain antitoxin
MEVTFTIPDDLARRIREQQDRHPQWVLEALVVQAYKDDVLTADDVRRVLDLSSRWETEEFLRERGAFLEYSPSDLERDIAAIRSVREKKG